jgi:AcrR family transcriptional regulator
VSGDVRSQRRFVRRDARAPVRQGPPTQRARVVQVVAEIVCANSTLSPPLGEIITAAGVSTRTFKLLFDGCEDCVLAAFDDAVALATADVRTAARGASDWLTGLRAATQALLELADEHPELARLCLLYAPLGPPPFLRRCREQTDAVARALATRAPQSEALRPWTARSAIGAAFGLLHARLSLGATRLRLLQGELTAALVRPYLGGAAAARERARYPL